MRLKRSRAATLAGVALFMAGCRAASESDTPGAYSVQMAVVPAPGSSLQRIPLPPAAYVRSEKPDLSDLRLFDGTGKRLPVALADDRDVMPASERTTAVPTYPIVGPVMP